jgi:hypothetical protein
VILSKEGSLAGQRLNHALTLELGIRLSDGVSVEAQFFRKRPDRGQCLARLQCSRRRGGPDLIDQLEIGRFAGLEVDLKEQAE